MEKEELDRKLQELAELEKKNDIHGISINVTNGAEVTTEDVIDDVLNVVKTVEELSEKLKNKEI